MDLTNFYVIGLSYKEAQLSIREQFSLSNKSSIDLLNNAYSIGINELIINNTCNRIELYGFANNSKVLIELVCKYSGGKISNFEKYCYTLLNEDAINHIFRVGLGLESQILGDFEIIGQLKQSFYRSKNLRMAHGFSERLINSTIQASKRVKTETGISTGAASVSFAAVRYILQNIKNVGKRNILLFGAGKIGRNTCENLIKHTKNEQIVLINRTIEQAEKMAGKFKVNVKPFSELSSQIRQADILIVATGSQNPTIDQELIHCSSPLLVLDLSLPRNVDPEISKMQNVTLIHLDQLSKLTDDTLEKRKKHIPKAEKILNELKAEFLIWMNNRKYAPFLHAVKNHFENSNKDIEKTAAKFTGQIASYLKENPENANETIDLLANLFELEI